MPLVTMSIRMDAEIKRQFEDFCEEVGLTPYRSGQHLRQNQCCVKDRLPFEITTRPVLL